ncbi:MAG: hypothetical protein H7174_07505 [Flavobacterium sp.]|nr:hypothetical protein [Flavobacterium sp.]
MKEILQREFDLDETLMILNHVISDFYYLTFLHEIGDNSSFEFIAASANSTQSKFNPK